MSTTSFSSKMETLASLLGASVSFDDSRSAILSGMRDYRICAYLYYPPQHDSAPRVSFRTDFSIENPDGSRKMPGEFLCYHDKKSVEISVSMSRSPELFMKEIQRRLFPEADVIWKKIDAQVKERAHAKTLTEQHAAHFLALAQQSGIAITEAKTGRDEAHAKPLMMRKLSKPLEIRPDGRISLSLRDANITQEEALQILSIVFGNHPDQYA